MKVIKLSAIDWPKALDRLSIGAFYLLTIIIYRDIDMSDEEMMRYTGFGLSTHRKYKKELVSIGYLTVEQIGKCEYLYHVGDVK